MNKYSISKKKVDELYDTIYNEFIKLRTDHGKLPCSCTVYEMWDKCGDLIAEAQYRVADKCIDLFKIKKK